MIDGNVHKGYSDGCMVHSAADRRGRCPLLVIFFKSIVNGRRMANTPEFLSGIPLILLCLDVMRFDIRIITAFLHVNNPACFLCEYLLLMYTRIIAATLRTIYHILSCVEEILPLFL